MNKTEIKIGESHYKYCIWFMDMAMKKKVTLRYRDRYNSVHSE